MNFASYEQCVPQFQLCEKRTGEFKNCIFKQSGCRILRVQTIVYKLVVTPGYQHFPLQKAKSKMKIFVALTTAYAFELAQVTPPPQCP